MGERIAPYPFFMPDSSSPKEEAGALKPLSPEELATKYFFEESRKPDGGNSSVKNAIWLSGLSHAFDKEKAILNVVEALIDIENFDFGLDKKQVLVERVVQFNNKPDPHSYDSRKFDSSRYKKMLSPQTKTTAKAA